MSLAYKPVDSNKNNRARITIFINNNANEKRRIVTKI
jgi:hypothetical protein